jgi:hypothetical protein
MRGMNITLIMTNIKFKQSKYPKTGVREAYGSPTPEVISFDFGVTVTQDPQAVSAQAEPPAAAEPVFRLAGQPDKLFRSCSAHKQAHVDGYPVLESRLSGRYPYVRPITRSFEVRPGTTSFRFSPEGQDNGEFGAESFSIPITDEQGRRACVFRCGAMGSYWELNWITQCSLSAAGTHTDLLRDAIDLYSRRAMGIVLVSQMQNECQSYPDFGASRTFRLRGMQLSLSFTEVKFDPKSENPGFVDDPGLINAHLTISVKVDPTAVDPVAMPSPYIWADFEPGFLKHCLPVYRAEAGGDSLKR